MKNFINLHTNTEYSILESSIKIDDLISFAQKHELSTLAITDHNNMFGVAEFIEKTRAHKIKPIIGLDLDVDDYRLILLAKNYDGYLELLHLSSTKMNGNNININDINAENLLVIDHPRFGYYKIYARQPKIKNYYLGLNEGTDPKGVAIFEVRTLLKNSDNTLAILQNIKNGAKINDNAKDDFSFPLNPKMEYSMTKQAENIAKMCNITFPHYTNLFPKFDKEKDSHQLLKKILSKSLKMLITSSPKLSREKYIDRCKYELKIISSMGYEDYFLILSDMTNWAKAQKIMIGPGRGSASGSLVSYLLGITQIDPLKYDLLFERFLNPERITMPDIDIDIQDDRREEVVNYFIQKYGSEHVAQIVTFSILGAKSSLKDAARALDISPRDVDIISKLIKIGRGNFNPSLETIYNKVAAFRSRIDDNKQYTELLRHAQLIERLPRQTGTHAAGIVLASKKIEEIIPIMKSVDGKTQTQFSMNYLERNGLLKIDLLGLRNLTIIKEIQAEIFKNYKRKINLKKINLNDRITNELFSRADTNGIFQFESWGMKDTLKKIKVHSIDDVIAIIALYRPGPMQFINEYAACKQRLRIISYVDDSLEAILKPTYGIIIFQEQIMQIVQVYAGMSLGQADIFRRAISKKNTIKLNQQKDLFFGMSKAQNRNEKTTKEVWDLIFKFANYGFAKSHAVAYSVISYWMAFLKARFPIEFYTPLLNSAISSARNTELYFNEIKSKGIKIIPPSINTSMRQYHNLNRKIYMPLICLKGLGEVMNNKIITERITNGKYKSFLDFIIRAKKVGVSDSVIEIIIKSNSISEFGNVHSLLLSLAPALRFASMVIIKDGDSVKIDTSIISSPLLIKVSREIPAEVDFQKYYIGFPISTFLTDMYKNENTLRDVNRTNETIVIAQVKWIKKIITKKDSKEMAFITIFDRDITIEATIMPDLFKFYPKIKSGEIYKFSIISSNYKENISYQIREIERVSESDKE